MIMAGSLIKILGVGVLPAVPSDKISLYEYRKKIIKQKSLNGADGTFCVLLMHKGGWNIRSAARRKAIRSTWQPWKRCRVGGCLLLFSSPSNFVCLGVWWSEMVLHECCQSRSLEPCMIILLCLSREDSEKEWLRRGIMYPRKVLTSQLASCHFPVWHFHSWWVKVVFQFHKAKTRTHTGLLYEVFWSSTFQASSKSQSFVMVRV